jgi:hypothetical protein
LRPRFSWLNPLTIRFILMRSFCAGKGGWPPPAFTFVLNGISAQKVYGKSAQSGMEKYARVSGAAPCAAPPKY